MDGLDDRNIRSISAVRSGSAVSGVDRVLYNYGATVAATRMLQAPHPLSGAGGKVRQHEGEGADEHARQLVDDGDLLEDGARVVERRQEADVAVAYPRRILDEQVGEPIRKMPTCIGKPGSQLQPRPIAVLRFSERCPQASDQRR